MCGGGYSWGKTIGADEFSLSVYPASQPVFMELVKNGRVADLMAAGATGANRVLWTMLWAGDVPANRGLASDIRQEISQIGKDQR